MAQPFVSGLLGQAEDLIDQAGPGRPKQADLRRAVSAGYYAVFHQIVNDVCVFVLGVSDSKGPVGARLRRTVHHKSVKSAALWFSSAGRPPPALHDALADPIPVQLRELADRVIVLQEARHRADYNLTEPVTMTEARWLVAEAREAIDALASLQSSPAKSVFLLGCLLGKRLTDNE